MNVKYQCFHQMQNIPRHESKVYIFAKKIFAGYLKKNLIVCWQETFKPLKELVRHFSGPSAFVQLVNNCCGNPTKLLPHLAPSWILSYAENLASLSLQDGATEWHDYVLGTHPPTHPVPNLSLI